MGIFNGQAEETVGGARGPSGCGWRKAPLDNKAPLVRMVPRDYKDPWDKRPPWDPRLKRSTWRTRPARSVRARWRRCHCCLTSNQIR